MHGSLLGSRHLPVVGVNVASIPAGLSVVAVAAIDGSNANNRRWNGGIGLLLSNKKYYDRYKRPERVIYVDTCTENEKK